MRIGPLRHRIALQQLVAGSPQQSASGAPDVAWSTLATVWGSVEPLSGRELVAAQQVNAEVSTWIGIRYLPGIVPTMRVVHPGDGGRVYQILAVLPDPTLRGWIRLMCSSGLTRGQ